MWKINMRLDLYLKEKNISQEEFGQSLTPPTSQGLISQWVCGRTRITLDYSLQIQQVTKGLVSPQDCADMFVGVQK